MSDRSCCEAHTQQPRHVSRNGTKAGTARSANGTSGAILDTVTPAS